MELVWFALFWLISAAVFALALVALTGILVELLITLTERRGGGLK